MALYVGLMSGTSMDGIDAAVVDVATQQLIKGITRPYSAETSMALASVLHTTQPELSTVYQLNTLIGRDFGLVTNQLLAEANLSKHAITAIGSHGQTILHDADAPIPYTAQLGCAHTIAEITKLPVIADFRTRDMVLGGKGAPFAPLYHQQLFRQVSDSLSYPFAVVNIGGIANLTLLSGPNDVRGYDLGPGNCLLDAWITLHRGQAYDADGAWARQGVMIPSLLEAMLGDPFLQKPAPKSIGKEYFSLRWLQQYLGDLIYDPKDIQATLIHLTAHGIVREISADSSIQCVIPGDFRAQAVQQLVLCGGGAHNQYLLSVLRELLPQLLVCSSQDVGINPDFIEAQMMAWLAYQRLINQPLDLKAITGAKHEAILGVFYPAGIDK